MQQKITRREIYTKRIYALSGQEDIHSTVPAGNGDLPGVFICPNMRNGDIATDTPAAPSLRVTGTESRNLPEAGILYSSHRFRICYGKGGR